MVIIGGTEVKITIQLEMSRCLKKRGDKTILNGV
jgi:hypothetical protein